MNKTLRFGIHGARGRMGQAVARLLAEGGHTLAAQFDQGDALTLNDCDAVIDFSTPAASLILAEACSQDRINRATPLVLIVGSTGFSAEQDLKISTFTDQVCLIKSGNFSLGVNLMVELARQAAARLKSEDFDIEIMESHHRRKVDAPSGTALMLGRAAAEGRGTSLDSVMAGERRGQTGPRKPGEIGFAVLRGGDIIGEHSLSLISDEEILTISHSARDRALFARGAIYAALWAQNKPCGFYTMREVLGFSEPSA